MPSPSPDLRPLLAQQIARIALLGCYPNIPTDPARQIAWVEAMADDLADVPVNEVAEAFAAFRKSTDPADRFLPTPGRILALTPSRLAMIAAKEKGSERWESMIRLVGSIGVDALATGPESLWSRWPTTDPLGSEERTAILAGIRAVGGTGTIGRHTNVGVLRPTFLAAYTATLEAAKRVTAPQVTAAEPRRIA